MSQLSLTAEPSLFTSSDIGAVRIPGQHQYDPESQIYTLSGSGKNMWLAADEFHFAWRQITGDFILTARVAFIGKGVDAHRKIGCIVRSSLKPESAYADAALHGDGLTSLQFRRSDGAQTEELRSRLTHADVLQISRTGDRVTARFAHFGEPFTDEQSLDLPLGHSVYVGLFITSHNSDVLEQATFTDVRLVAPAPASLVPYRDYLGSLLQILDTTTGHCRIVSRTRENIEAPNWTPDGKSLIYNSRGLLYRFDLATHTATQLDTGEANRNNNDHVLSFDGKTLGISSAHETGKSQVYVVPSTGGQPRRITPVGPSYLHGFSPDGATVVYTAERGDNNYDIYACPVAGGAETRLTTAPGLDDGSEFSPDGKSIYFNSVRSGLMQLWRMRPDGSQQEQITEDGFNNWFPHISPDGSKILFLSYGTDVEPSNHPYYKHVYLRMMPIAGGQPQVLAYLYGGQGTINVPSWSPDSRFAAFVSHTGQI